AAGAAPAGALAAAAAAAQPLSSTKELVWIKLSQSYSFPEEGEMADAQPFSPIEWEARTATGGGVELSWRGNLDVYGEGIGYQDVSVGWTPSPTLRLHGEWRTTRDSAQDFLDVGGELTLGRVDLGARSRYNLTDEVFVENRLSVKYTSQCWDVSLSYVHWPDQYEYTLILSLKGIGTVVKL
ncbi:MAG TPA: hypothetical protein VI078_09410, partial [bacterium]